jgi:hypothetical protein
MDTLTSLNQISAKRQLDAIRLSIPQTSHRHFTSLARRLGRIFAHAYFHHREAFEQAEAESSLYARFLGLTSRFDLVPAEFLVIPPRLEERSDVDPRSEGVRMPRLLGPSMDNTMDSQGGTREHFQRQREHLQRQREGWPLHSEHGGVQKEQSPPGLNGNGSGRSDSPRRFGRQRTDTMVFSEASAVSEELAKSLEEYASGSSGLHPEERDASRYFESILPIQMPPPAAAEPELPLEPGLGESADIDIDKAVVDETIPHPFFMPERPATPPQQPAVLSYSEPETHVTLYVSSYTFS